MLQGNSSIGSTYPIILCCVMMDVYDYTIQVAVPADTWFHTLFFHTIYTQNLIYFPIFSLYYLNNCQNYGEIACIADSNDIFTMFTMENCWRFFFPFSFFLRLSLWQKCNMHGKTHLWTATKNFFFVFYSRLRLGLRCLIWLLPDLSKRFRFIGPSFRRPVVKMGPIQSHYYIFSLHFAF